MLEIDGAFGEGGGQVLRSSVALAMITGQPFRIFNIRGGRSKPGLMRQHLAGLNAAATICQAKTRGLELRSREVTFQPGSVAGGDHTFKIGSAGSVCLVLQTILPALLTAKDVSRVAIEGGTHVPFAPTYEFLDQVYFPVLESMGARIERKQVRPGFMPAGGGRIEVEIHPVLELDPLELVDRGALNKIEITAAVSGIPVIVAEREIEAVREVLDQQVSPEKIESQVVQLPRLFGPGNAIHTKVESASGLAMFTGLGQRGVRAETVGKRLGKVVRRYLSSSAPVGPHLADQLLLPMAMAGKGKFVTRKPTEHTATNMKVIETFLPLQFRTRELEDEDALIEVVGL